jgi:hypothetical protein
MAQWSEEEAGRHIRRAKDDKAASDEIYREAVELTFPDRENWTKQKEGSDKSGYAWDSAPQVNVIRAANRLSSDFTPQFVPWLEIGLGPAAQKMPDGAFTEATGKTKDEAKLELEATTAIVQAIFQGPGFPTASNELYIDWHFGQGGMQIMPNDDPLDSPVQFSSLPLSHFYAYEGPNGKLDRWFFWHEKRVDAIQQEWPDAKLSDQLGEMIAEAKEGKKRTAKLCGVVYRDYDEKDRQFRYEVFHVHSKGCDRIVQRQTRTPPYVTPRYAKLPGENRGRGPVLFAIPDIRTANKIVEMTLRAAALAVSGVYTVTESGVSGPVRIKPLAVMKVRSNGGANGPSLQRLDTPSQIDFGELLLEKLHENIQKVIGDNSLPAEAGPIRTATEFIQRSRELIADQAGGLGRLYAEFIIPSVQRVVDILESKGMLPTDGLKIDQFLIEVRMLSPMAKGEAMSEVENVVRFIEMLKMLGGDEVLALEVDVTKATEFIGDRMNVPHAIRNSQKKKAELMKKYAAVGAAEAGGDPAVAEQSVEDQMNER